jgi:hypothetical protein
MPTPQTPQAPRRSTGEERTQPSNAPDFVGDPPSPRSTAVDDPEVDPEEVVEDEEDVDEEDESDQKSA